MPGQTFAPVSFDYEIVAGLSPEVKIKIREMMDNGIDINKELMEFFKGREVKIAQEKEQIVGEVKNVKMVSRHIPAKIKKIIKKEYGSKCSKSECARPAENLHHSRGFAIYKSHDPRFFQPLCHEHHEIEHMSDKYVQKYRVFK